MSRKKKHAEGVRHMMRMAFGTSKRMLMNIFNICVYSVFVAFSLDRLLRPSLFLRFAFEAKALEWRVYDLLNG